MKVKNKRVDINSYQEIKETPHFLNLIIWFCMGGGFLIVSYIISIAYKLLYEKLPFGKVLASGDVFILIIGTVLFISGIAFLKRLKWGRILLLLYIPIGVISSAIMKLHSQYDLIELSIIYFIFLLPTGIWYLFFNKNVKAYFN